MICCPVLVVILWKGRGIYYLLEGTLWLVAGVSHAVPLEFIFLSTFHIPLSPSGLSEYIYYGCYGECDLLNPPHLNKNAHPLLGTTSTQNF